jgi:Ca2+-binding EF-hand superfamily protein
MAMARDTFSKYDTDKDGRISSDDLFATFKGLLSGLCPEDEATKD